MLIFIKKKYFIFLINKFLQNEKNTNKRVSQIKAALNSPRRSSSIILDWDKDF